MEIFSSLIEMKFRFGPLNYYSTLGTTYYYRNNTARHNAAPSNNEAISPNLT